MNMNSEVKKKWLNALRSGEYKQGTNFLHKILNDEHMFCCLGVLCDLYLKENPDKNWELNLNTIDGKRGVHSLSDSKRMLPTEVIVWAGMDVEERANMEMKLSNHNDGYYDKHFVSTPFSEIANIIEAEM